MLKGNFAVYNKRHEEGIYYGYIAEEDFFLVLEAEGLEEQHGTEVLKSIREEVLNSIIEHLVDFNSLISEKIKELHPSSHISLATGLVNDKVLYLKTINSGNIYVCRDNNFAKIIGGNKTASGYIQSGDKFIFTLDSDGGDDEGLKELVQGKKPAEIVETLTNETTYKGNTTVFIEFEQIDVTVVVENTEPDKEEFIDQELPSNSYQSKRFKLPDWNSLPKGNRKITMGIVALLAIVFIWSIVLGYQRREVARLQNRIDTTKQHINQKLNEASDASFLNMPQAVQLLSETKDEFRKLKEEIDNSPQKNSILAQGKENQLKQIEMMINEKEKSITKKEDKQAEEFFDLSLDAKDAKGIKMYRDKEITAILDKENGSIYLLSLTKKSIDKKNINEVKKAELIGFYNDVIYFFVPSDGMYKIAINGDKASKVISKDQEWGTIRDIGIYNGNLYLLDTGKDRIYKYLSTEKGFSEKSDYVQGNIFLTDSSTIAIDSSVYINLQEKILKFTAGASDEFKTTFPTTDIALNKVITDKDLSKVYSWDKKNKTIYILDKSGGYERQISSSRLAESDDVVIYDNTAYLLIKQKIYKLSLN